jgi:TonB family protein
MLRSAVVMIVVVAGVQPAAAQQAVDVCGDAFVQAINPAGVETCRGLARLTVADALPAGSAERRAHLEGAADHFSRAARAAVTAEEKVTALQALVNLYDTRLNDPSRLELALRDLIAADPGRTDPLFRLAQLQEDQQLFDAAEQTLLWTRQQHALNPEAYRRLARFYERRALAAAGARMATGSPDEDGTYRVGGRIAMPRRTGGTRYPELPAAAAAAGVRGPVMLEFTVTETGTVADVRMVSREPLLEEEAVRTVQEWTFLPTLLDGSPIRLRLTTTLQFRR